MSSHQKSWPGWQTAVALAFAVCLGACSSDGGGVAFGGGGPDGGGSGSGSGSGGGSGGGGSGGGSGGGDGDAGSTGTVSRVVSGTTDLTGGLLSTAGNAAMGGGALSELGENLQSNGVGGLPAGGSTLNGAIDSADNALNGVAKVSLDNEAVVGSSNPSSSQLIGANVLSSNPQSGTLATATVSNTSPSLTGSGLVGVNANGLAINPTGGTPLVGVNVSATQPVQGSLVTGTVAVPPTGTSGPLSTGILNPVLPNTATTAGNTNGTLGNLLPGQ